MLYTKNIAVDKEVVLAQLKWINVTDKFVLLQLSYG